MKNTPLYFAACVATILGILPTISRIRSVVIAIVFAVLLGGCTILPIENAYYTPLHDAAEKGNVAIVKLLISGGADVNAIDHDRQSTPIPISTTIPAQRWTPLHLAAYGGHAEVINILLAAGAIINAMSIQGITPLDLAKRTGNLAAIAALEKAGGKCNKFC